MLLNTLWLLIIAAYAFLVANNLVSSGFTTPALVAAQKMLEIVRGTLAGIGLLMTLFVYIGCFGHGYYILKPKCEPVKQLVWYWYVIVGVFWAMQLIFALAEKISTYVNPTPGIAAGGGGPMGMASHKDDS